MLTSAWNHWLNLSVTLGRCHLSPDQGLSSPDLPSHRWIVIPKIFQQYLTQTKWQKLASRKKSFKWIFSSHPRTLVLLHVSPRFIQGFWVPKIGASCCWSRFQPSKDPPSIAGPWESEVHSSWPWEASPPWNQGENWGKTGSCHQPKRLDWLRKMGSFHQQNLQKHTKMEIEWDWIKNPWIDSRKHWPNFTRCVCPNTGGIVLHFSLQFCDFDECPLLLLTTYRVRKSCLTMTTRHRLEELWKKSHMEYIHVTPTLVL